MKKKILFLFLFTAINIFAQSKKDTLYFYFDYGKQQELGAVLKKDNKVISRSYLFKIDNTDNFYFQTGINGYLTFKDVEKNEKAEIKWINKKFIKENKKIIYDINKILESDMDLLIEKINKSVIFLIDSKIKRRNKMKAEQVIFSLPERM